MSDTLRRSGHRPHRAVAFLFAVLALAALPAQAQEQHRAGLVVVHGDGRVVRQCVSFDEENISGYDLLQRSGLDLSVEAGAIGATICALDGEGCKFPQENCFCECQGSPCVYWSYWQLTGDGWQYRNLGAAYTQVSDGAVEGWHWKAGTLSDAPEPPAVTFAEICPAEARPTQLAAATAQAAQAVSAQAAMAAQPSATAAAPPRSGGATQLIQPSPSLAFLGTVAFVLVAVPAAGAVFLLMRRGRRQDQ